MSPTPLTLLIAAPQPSQSAVLAEMVEALRPSLRVLCLGHDEVDANTAIDLLMVVELEPEPTGELSRGVRDRHPDAALILVAPRFDAVTLAIAAEVQAAAILACPCEPGTVTRVLEQQARTVRHAGRCGAVETSLLLRLHAAAGSDGILHLTSDGRSGAIHLEQGQPIHAYCGEIVGAEAVRELLGWTGTRATWMAGHSACSRTISGRIEGLLERDTSSEISQVAIEVAPRSVLDKLERLSQIEDILGVYLMRNSEIVTGHNDESLDPEIIRRALTRLSLVFHDMEAQQGDRAGSEIQATVGEHRLVVDRLGPMSLGYQVGVVVCQATPVCKSLRRLLRQLDRSFRKSLHEAARGGAGAASSGPGDASSLHRVA